MMRRDRVFRWLSGLVCGLAVTLRLAAAETVGGVRVFDRPFDGGLQLVVSNDYLAAVTLTVVVTGENAIPDVDMPVIVTCRGRGVFPVAALRPARDHTPVRYRVRYDWQFGEAGVTNNPQVVYELPYSSGRGFRVAQGYGGTFTHTGNNEFAVDFGMPIGTPVRAAREGVVEVVVDGFEQGGQDPALRNRVNMILVRHPDGTYGEYAHLGRAGASVRPGQKITVHELLGLSGNTGFTRGPHLHFAVFRALDGVRRETFPIRFRAREGELVEPAEGVTLTAP